MTIRNLAIPLLSGGLLLLGYLAFSRRRQLPPAPDSNGPSTLREAGLRELGASSAHEKPPVAPTELRRDPRRPEPIGARFLGRLSDALSPFGGAHEREPVDPRPHFD